MFNYLYKKIKLSTKLKFFNKNTGGRSFKGNVICRTEGIKYNRTVYFKVNMRSILLKSPVFFRTSYLNKLKTSYSLVMSGGAEESIVPINDFKTIGYLYYKDKNNLFINTIEGFGFGEKVSWLVSGSRKIATSLGSYCSIIFRKEDKYVLLMPSGYLNMFDKDIIVLRNKLFNKKLIKFYNGFKKLKVLGKKSTVRGIAKNPNDHPHGGRTNSVLRPKTPWGKSVIKNR